MKIEPDHLLSLVRAAKTILLGVRSRVVVDREAIAKILFERPGGPDTLEECNETADAVISALGARDVPTVGAMAHAMRAAEHAWADDPKDQREEFVMRAEAVHSLLAAAPDVVIKEEPGVYMVNVDLASGSVGVKEYEFFKSQGGLREEWGKHWAPVIATGIEDAREKGCSLPGARPYERQTKP